METYADVVFKTPLNTVFTYAYKGASCPALRFKRVLVPFGKSKQAVGFVVRESQEPSYAQGPLKAILEVLDQKPLLGEVDFELAKWLAHYYQSSLGEAISLMVSLSRSALPKTPTSKPPNANALSSSDGKPVKALELNKEQQNVAKAIKEHVGTYKAFLLHGITGSGKTYVYLELIRHALSMQRQAIFLVPEIGLTPQLQRTMEVHFGEGRFAVLHSKVSALKKRRIYAASMRGDINILVGPRSCLFAPTPRLGLVIIDEEHDNAYKNDASPRYHARGVAQQKCKLHKALLVLGSATPSMEAYHQACVQKNVVYCELRRRFFDLALPSVRCMPPATSSEEGGTSMLPVELLRLMYETLSLGQQAILYLNHRGYSQAVFCTECNHWARCRRCALSLSYHKRNKKLLCHQCGYSVAFGGRKCPKCGRFSLKHHKAGTEQLVQEIEQNLPMAKVLQFDSDSVRTPKSIEQALQSILNQEVNVVVGTQMIIKGHDFPKVQLVVMVMPEDALRFPDYRASERAFSQIVQVSGRAGRRHNQGNVVLLTRLPEDDSIRFGVAQDSTRFYESELQARKELNYPPFAKMCRLVVRGSNEKQVAEAMQALGRGLAKQLDGVAEVLGPAPCLLSQIKHHYRWNILLKVHRIRDFLNAFPGVRRDFVAPLIPNNAYLEVDMDPIDLL